MKYINYIIGVLLALSISLNIGLGIALANKGTNIIEREIKVTDTLTITKDSIVEHIRPLYIKDYDTVFVMITDTDTIEVPMTLPIEYMTYEDTIDHDSIKYDVKIDYSGFRPSLDGVYVHSNYIKQETIIKKPKPWRQFIGAGIQVGYGTTFPEPKFSPYVGVGITYGFGYTW